MGNTKSSVYQYNKPDSKTNLPPKNIYRYNAQIPIL